MPLKMCEIIRTVVVLPFEPVTATIGIREGVPAGNSRSATWFATNGAPASVGGGWCRGPGAPAAGSPPAPGAPGRHALGDGDHPPPDDEHPVVAARDVALDHDIAPARLGQRTLKAG